MKLKIILIMAVLTISFSCKKSEDIPTSTSLNIAPQLSSIGNQTAEVGQTVNVTLSATDPDGDSLSFSIPVDPGFLSISGFNQSGNTATATLVISPGENDTGTSNATVKVSDGEGGEDSESFSIEVPEAVQGMWLEYWSGAQPARLQLGSVQYYCVRFTKPPGWNNISIDKVKIVFADSGQQIELCFWESYTFQGDDYWPSGSPLKGDTKSISSGGNTWDISSYNWTTNMTEFFVGFEQIGSVATLTGDGKCEPENRSYRYGGGSWQKEIGFMANYCISVYVTMRQESSMPRSS